MSRQFQFSLRGLLAAPVLVGLVAMAMTTDRDWVVIASVSMALLIQFAIILVLRVVGGRLPRGFGLGALFPAGVGAIWTVKPLFLSPRVDWSRDLGGMIFRNFLQEWGRVPVEDFRFRLGSVLLATLVCGLAGMATAWVCSPLDQQK